MLRQISRTLLPRSPVSFRFLSTGLPAASAVDEAFVEAWKKVAPNIEPPKTPLSFMKPRPPIPPTIPGKLTVNFVLPYQSELANKEVYFPPFFVVSLFYTNIGRYLLIYSER